MSSSSASASASASASVSASVSAGNNLIVAENYLKNTLVRGYSQMTDTTTPFFDASAELVSLKDRGFAHSPLYFPEPSLVENREYNLTPDRNNPCKTKHSFCIDNLTFSEIAEPDKCINCWLDKNTRYNGNKCGCKAVICSPACLQEYVDYASPYKKCPTCENRNFFPTLRRYKVVGTEKKITLDSIFRYRKELDILQNIKTFAEIAEGLELWSRHYNELTTPFQRLYWNLGIFLQFDYFQTPDADEADIYKTFYISHYGTTSPVDWNEIDEPEYTGENYSLVFRGERNYSRLDLRFLDLEELIDEIVSVLDNNPFQINCKSIFHYFLEDKCRESLGYDDENAIWEQIVESENDFILRKLLKTGDDLRKAIRYEYLKNTDFQTHAEVFGVDFVFILDDVRVRQDEYCDCYILCELVNVF